MLDTAIILAGGFGTRLQSVVTDLPKPMAPLNDKPFLDYQLNYLKHFGIKNVIFSVGYLSDKIINHYKSLFNELHISYVIEEKPLGTGGGIRLALENCNKELVLVLNGDSFFDVDLKKFHSLHVNSEASMSIALRKVEDSARYGTIKINEQHKIISFEEKTNKPVAGTINAGVYLLNKKQFLDLTLANENFSIEKDFFEKQINHLNIKGFEFEGYFIDIGIPSDYLQAQNDFKRFKYK